MVEAKMSIAESSSEAQMLIEPVRKPVAVFSRMRKAAASIERRATELFKASSCAAREEASSKLMVVAIRENYPPTWPFNSMTERVRVLRNLFDGAASHAPRDD